MLRRLALRLQRGFTAVELLVVLTVLAIGASLAAPNVAAMIANRKVQAVAQGILDGLNHARAEAVRRNAPVRFTLRTDGWTVTQAASGEVLQSATSPDWAALMVTSVGGPSVTFLPTGLLQAGAQLSQVTVAGTAEQGRTRRINVFGGGLIRMCDPAIAVADDPRRC